MGKGGRAPAESGGCLPAIEYGSFDRTEDRDKGMNFTENMQRVTEYAVKLAQEGRHRYFMPEHMIYGMTFDEAFPENMKPSEEGLRSFGRICWTF